MPNRDEWISALSSNRYVKIISSDELITKIVQRQDQRISRLLKEKKQPPDMKRSLTKVDQFSPQVNIELRPISLLHSISQVTTPTVPNLVDLNSTWALTRYIWAFELPEGGEKQDLKLSNYAREIDFHQKSLLSEEIGVGMAQYLMSKYLGATSSVDIDVALRNRGDYWGVKQSQSTMPDYIFFDSMLKNLYVVECKGTQSSRTTTYNQLRRGTEQVSSIMFPGKSNSSIVIATCMLPDSTEVYVIDPPGNEEYRSPMEKPNGKVIPLGNKSWKVSDPRKFQDDVNALNRAKLLAYAGATQQAISQLSLDFLTFKNKFLYNDKQMGLEESEHGRFYGTKMVMPRYNGLNIEVFQGLQEGVYLGYSKGDEDEGRYHLEELESSMSKCAKGSDGNKFVDYVADKLEIGAATRFQSISLDGTMLQIKIS